MPDALQLRSVFQNDSVIGRHLDGDDDSFDDDDDDLNSHRSSITTTDSDSTLVSHTTRNAQSIISNASSSSTAAYNTGPKGVRSDARAFQHAQSQTQADKVRSASAALSSTAQATTWSQDKADADARDRWVEKRLKQLSKTGHRSDIEEVDAAGYLAIVESHQHVAVIIFSDDEEEEEVEVEMENGAGGRRDRAGMGSEFMEVMPSVVQSYQGIKVIKLHHGEAEMDSIACPAVLVYRDGELVVNCMRVADELNSGVEVSRRSVEGVLLRLGILKQEFRLD